MAAAAQSAFDDPNAPPPEAGAQPAMGLIKGGTPATPGAPTSTAGPYAKTPMDANGAPVTMASQPPTQFLDPNAAAKNGGLVAGGAPQVSTSGADNSAPPTGPWGQSKDMGGWIDSALAKTNNTTDDPNYWRTQMAKDPKAVAGDPSAIAWWQDAINRAEGSSLVKSGQLSLRNAGSQAPGQGGNYNVSGGPSTPGAGAQDPRWQSFYDQLQQRAQQSLNVDPNTDPIMRAQTDAYSAAATRGQRQNLSAIAEAAGPNANLTAETRHAGESVGQSTAAFQAQLAGREVDARRGEIAAALSGQMGVLSAADAFKLKQEDQALAQRSLNLQSQIGNRGMDITEQNNHWGQGFQDNSFNAGQQQQQWDNQYKNLFG